MSRWVPCGLVAQPAVITAATAVPATIISLCLEMMDIAHAPIGSNGPALNAVQVIDGCDRPVGAAHVGQLLDGGLHVAGLVGAAALQDCRFAVPIPWQAKARMANRQHRSLHLRIAPGLAAVAGSLDARNPAAAAPGETGDFEETRTGQFHFAGGEGNHRL